MSLISKLDSTSEQKLVFALQTAIDAAVKKGKYEPGIVANLTYFIPKHVNKLNLGAGSGAKITAGGVFIHQTPKVTFAGIKKQKSIEIGDLLLINTFINGSLVTRKAILYQAKLFKSLPVRPDNLNQHILYEKWPDFEYVNSGPLLNGKRRNVTGLDLHSSAKYLLLRNGKPLSMTPFHILHPKFKSGMAISAHPTNPLSTHECFIKESYHFVLGDAGKEFKLLKDGDPDIGWDRVINDLISVTAKKITSHMIKASGGAGSTRGCMLFGEGLSFVDNGINMEMMDGEPPGDIPLDHMDEFDSDGEGVSIIEFVVRSDSEEEHIAQ